MKKIKWLCLCMALLTGYHSFAQEKAPFRLREGKHNFTLQWVGWHNPGKVLISKRSDGLFNVKGEQRSSEGFVTIDGTLKVLSPQELLFEGTIQTMEKSLNKGEVCEKKGVYHFLAKGARKYWRLQEMDNCEGNNVVDYVDIFF